MHVKDKAGEAALSFFLAGLKSLGALRRQRIAGPAATEKQCNQPYVLDQVAAEPGRP
jgi:hypothetical protein